MVTVHSKALKENLETGRIIGKYTQGKKGPGLIVTAGIHGNEPSGIFALKRIFEQLEEDQPSINGTFIGVAGNLKALDKGVRYIDHDLNRLFKFNDRESLKNSEVYELSEGKELHDIMELVEDFKNDQNITEVFFIDCHTTSSESQPYISAHDFPHSIYFALNIPCFTVVGLGKSIPGTSDDYFNSIGLTGFTFEAGQHNDLASIENHEAVIWLVLAHAGLVDHDEMSCYPHCDQVLRKNVVEGKKIFKVLYRHAIDNGQDFEMEPGYVNFQRIKEGELLAHEKDETIKSLWDARILMPLYQKQGNDGFFVVKETTVEEVT